MHSRFGLALSFLLCSRVALCQSEPNTEPLQGLATVTTLSQTESGRAALRSNYEITGNIQNGRLRLPTLFTFEEQQQQSLRDAYSTIRNLEQLADGLGTTLGAAYVARAHTDDTGAELDFLPAVQQLMAFAMSTSGTDSNAGKYLFANLTTDGTQPVTPELRAVLDKVHGETDAFGRAYHLPAGSPNANPFGNSRPFQTEHDVLAFSGRDYLNHAATSGTYQRGPAQDLTKSPSYPSGHTTYGYTGALLLGLLVPDRYPEMVVRGAEYGTSRILVGAHYAMDVVGGRTLALYDMAHLLANDPAYLRREGGRPASLTDFRGEVLKARAQVAELLAANCGNTVSRCAHMDISRFNDPAANSRSYASTQTYSLPVAYASTANRMEDVAKLAPEAGYLLTVAYPSLTLRQADTILTETEGPGGGFLDNGSAFGVYSRLNLYEATLRARTLEAGQHSPGK